MNYSIQSLFLEAFGLNVSKAYNPEISEGKPNNPNAIFSGIEVIKDKDKASEISSLGTPIIFPIWFTTDSIFKKYNPNGSLDDKVKMRDFRLPITCIAEFSRSKNISVTKLNGSYTSVKEIYGFNDWNISINGFFLQDNSQPQGLYTPIQQEKELLEWDNLACSIPIESIPFNNLGIRNITITDLRIQALRGKPNIRAFTITALSDEMIELNIKSSLLPTPNQ